MGNSSGQPICRKCRRQGEKLFLKGDRCLGSKCAFTRRSYPPGAHGISSSRRISGYGKQLREKQRAKIIYGISERQLKNYYDKVVAKKGSSLLSVLETRFDNVIFRLGLASSRKTARQLVSHGLFRVNGKKMDIASYLVKTGDEISIKVGKEKHAALGLISNNLKRISLPAWLQLDLKSITGKVLSLPKDEDVDTPVEEKLIIEYYSR